MSDEQKTQPETTAQPQAPAQPSAELTVQDLNALKQIIDVASQRGTFKPSEMVVVGQTYNKLESFLAAVAAQQPKKEGE
jgi:translation initiation factor IF-2